MRKIIFIVCLFMSANCVLGQSFSASTTGTVTVNSVLLLTVNNLTGITSFTSISDYKNGKIVLNYATVTVKSNVPWLLSLSSPATFTAMGGGASTNMPASIASFRETTAGGAFYPVTTTGMQITGNPGNTSTTGNTINLDMDFTPGFSYSGGSYSLTLLYTLTNQ